MNITAITSYNSISGIQNQPKKNNNQVKTIQPVRLQNNSPSFGRFLIDDLFFWGKKKLNNSREIIRQNQIKDVRSQVHDDIALLSNRLGISKDEAKTRYQADLDIAGIQPSLNGHEEGLNRVVGYSLEKLELMKKAVAPILNSVNGKTSQYPVPNGIILYGPHGTGKSYMAASLMEHLSIKSPKYKNPVYGSNPLYINKIKTKTIDKNWTTGDTDDNFEALFETFEQAKRDGGNGFHTVILINDFDKLMKNSNTKLLQKELEFSTQHPSKNGITWIGITNDITKQPEWIFDTNRTSMIIPVKGYKTDAETSAAISHFISEVGRKDNSNHNKILDHLNTTQLPKFPQYIMEFVDKVNRNLMSKDYYSCRTGQYKAPVKDKLLMAAIDECKADNYHVIRRLEDPNKDIFLNKGGQFYEN